MIRVYDEAGNVIETNEHAGVITFSGGIVKIPFELSPEIQTKYGYDPKAAAEFTQKSIAERQALNAETQRAKETAEATRMEQLSTARDE